MSSAVSTRNQQSTTPKLDAKEKADLKRCETVIKKGQTAFLAMAQAIQEIDRKKLFRTLKIGDSYCSSISAYCKHRWDMSPSDVTRARGAAVVLENLSNAGIADLPHNQHQAMQLCRLSADDQIKAWTAVLESGKKPTGTLVESVVKEMFGVVDESTDDNGKGDDNAQDEVQPLDFRPVLEGLQSLDAEVARNNISPEDREALREQLKAAEELLAHIKSRIG